MTDISANIRDLPAKAPAATLDYSVSLAGWMAKGAPDDVLSQFVITAITPADNSLSVSTPPVITGSVAVFWLSGGVDGTEYGLSVQVQTAQGRIDSFVLTIGVLDPLAAVEDRLGAGQA